jgi:hypothetical protein
MAASRHNADIVRKRWLRHNDDPSVGLPLMLALHVRRLPWAKRAPLGAEVVARRSRCDDLFLGQQARRSASGKPLVVQL